MSASSSPSATPFPTTISGSRFTIDRFNLTFQRSTDVDAFNGQISVGAQVDPYGDSYGTLVTTAVLIKSPVNPLLFPNLLYRPVRVDLLMYSPDIQTGRFGISDFFVTLYSDDGSAARNPAIQVRQALVCAHALA
jgi:hypothetical protein